MMIRSTALRRLVTSRCAKGRLSTYHTSIVAADALDMRDTFARRHREFNSKTHLLVLINNQLVLSICESINLLTGE